MSATTAQKQKKARPAKEFSKEEKAKILDKLITARVGLLLRHPFFGNMATRMQLIDATHWLCTRSSAQCI